MQIKHQNRRSRQERKQRGNLCGNKQRVASRNARNSAKSDEYKETQSTENTTALNTQK